MATMSGTTQYISGAIIFLLMEKYLSHVPHVTTSLLKLRRGAQSDGYKGPIELRALIPLLI